jgi:hypothetical protein
MESDPLNHEDLKALAAERGRPLYTLHAQSANTDPWMAGMPYRRKGAEWFAAQWERLGAVPGTHTRRFHYLLISQASPVPMWNGSPYINTDECFDVLNDASAAARQLDLIPARDVVD